MAYSSILWPVVHLSEMLRRALLCQYFTACSQLSPQAYWSVFEGQPCCFKQMHTCSAREECSFL